MRRNYYTSTIIHILLLLLFFMFPLMHSKKKQEVQSVIVVDFSRDDDTPKSTAAVSKRSAAPAEVKPVVKPQPAATPKSTSQKLEKTKATVQKVADHEGEVVPSKVVKKHEKVIPVGPTPAEIAEAKRQAEEAQHQAELAQKKSNLAGLLSKSKKRATSGSSSDAQGGDTTGVTDKGDASENGQSNIRGALGNRKVIKVPTIKDDSQKKGRVVVKICVDAVGDVISSKYTMMGSTTSDTYLIALAEKGAKQYKFSTSKNPKECGNVVIDFLLK